MATIRAIRDCYGLLDSLYPTLDRQVIQCGCIALKESFSPNVQQRAIASFRDYDLARSLDIQGLPTTSMES